MANLKEVRTRIASVSSTQQITSAMKMVSAAKFRRAQNAIIGMRPYAAMLSEIVSDIDVGDSIQTPYHRVRRVERVLLVVVTSNKGLCGAFNANVIKETSAQLEAYTRQGIEVKLITMGKRGSEFFAKQKDLVLESYDDLLDDATFDKVSELCERLMAQFVEDRYDRIDIIYNLFKNSLTQVLTTEPFLPVKPAEASASDEQSQRNDYIYEPSKQTILEELVPLTLRSQFYRIVLDSLASEHGARMNAMQKATDNASELLKELRLSYNKARQAAITNEIIEIVSGSEALKSS